MAVEKSSFLLYTDSADIINRLTDEQAGMLFKGIMNYESDGVMPELDPITEIVFLTIKAHLDRNREKYEEVKKRRSEAGKKGMKSRWQGITNDNNVIENITNDNNVKSVITKITKDNKAYQSITNITVNDNDNDNGNVNVIVNDNENENVNDNDSPFSSSYLDNNTVDAINRMRAIRKRKAEA